MDAKDLRTESAVSERNNDGSKYSQGGGIALHCDRNKSYHDIGSNSLVKVDVQNARPCAVIGPDRVVPPAAVSEAYHLKKGLAEPWPCMDNAYRRPPEYPHKITNYQNPTRNISPRQTFQENMQRIMVPPTYSSVKVNDDTNYAQVSDRSNSLSKNIKLTMPPEAKFCDVPYAVNPSNNEQKNIRNPEMCLPSANPTLTRTAPHGWPPGSVNLRSTRMYSAPELYQFQEYPSCAGPRPVVPRPHRNVPEEQGYVYADPYYQEGNVRFKPYPSVKERYPQQRYEYIGNYSNPFHPPPGFPSHKYEVQKPIAPHPYPPYPPVKYLDSRVAEPVMEAYQRNPQGLGHNYNIQYRNQIHPTYGPVVGNGPQNKLHSYPPDAHIKAIPPNKLPYDSNAKTYIDYENNRQKIYPPTESYFVNEMARIPIKSQVIMPNYINMHNITQNPYYKKDTQQMKNYDHMTHLRNMDPNLNIHNAMSRHAPVFSPNALAISPTDSNTSNDTTQTLGTSQEDCGYVSQSSTASVRSIDSSINRIPNEYLRKYYDNYNRYGPTVRTSPMMSKSQANSNNITSKDKKQIDVRQFLQMWNEGDEEQEENSSKEIIIQTGSSDKNNFGKSHSQETKNSQEQLYVLGLVNVPSDELAKYEHIQKVSKLPENIKGYNSIELLNQFEEVIESSHMNNYKPPIPKESMYHMPKKGAHLKQATAVIPPRPVSPLDVESKISQSVIHKEVGCNFEIKPCSPKMLNVEVAAPVQNILAERAIEKVANPVILKPPILNGMNESIDCNMVKRTNHRMNMNENLRIPSCKMINTQYSNSNSIDQMKSSYSIQDLESNSGLCLASLPRLDNDIELNFPEVNQQFINANKGDSTVLTTSIRDLPTLEVLDQTTNQIKDKFNNTNPSRPDGEYDVDKSPYMIESEKEFSKLSKYRKTKTFEHKETLIHHNVNAFRTDSVIIKNPENMKNHEENSDLSNSLNKVIVDIQQAPINLTSQGSLSCNVESHPDNIDLQDVEKDKQMPMEIAIDFSLNKTCINSSEYMETKLESQMNASTHVNENPLYTLNKDESSDSVSLLPVFTEETENLTNMDDINGNYSLNSIKDGQDVPKPFTEIKDQNENIGCQQIPISNESYPKIETDIKKCALNDTEEMIGDVSSALLTSKTEIPSLVVTSNINSENCGTEICNSEDSTTNKLTEDVNYTTLMEIDSDISQNPRENLEENYEMDTTENATNVTIDEKFGNKHNFVNKVNSPVHVETKIVIDISEIDDPSDVRDPVVAEQTLQQDRNILISSEKTCCHDYESSDFIQSQSTNSESQLVSKDYMLNHINNSSDMQNSTTPSSVELSDNDEKLMDFEDTYAEDKHSILENTDLFDHDQLVDEDSEYQYEEPFRRNIIWHGSKELYSPWIQKLLTFSEGNCNSATTKNYTDRNNIPLVDSTEVSNTTEMANTTETTNTTEIANATEMTNTTESANTTEITHITETAKITGTLNTNEVTHITETAKITGSVNTIEVTQITETAYTTETANTTDPACTTEITNITVAADTTEVADSTEMPNTTEAVNTTETADTTEMTDTTKTAYTTDNTNTIETTNTTEASNTTETAKTIEAMNKIEVANKTDMGNTTETANTAAAADTDTENNDDNDISDCDSEIRKSVPLEEVSNKDVTEDVRRTEAEQDNCHGTVEITVESNSLSPTILDTNVDDTVNLEEHFECEESTQDEVINIKENMPSVDEADNIKENMSTVDEADNSIPAGSPLVTCKFNETNVIVIEPSLESETGNNKNTNIIAETQVDNDIITQCEVPDTSSNIEVLCESYQEEAEQCDEHPIEKHTELESSNHLEHMRFAFDEIQANDVPYRKCQRLKRSLSDSALNMYNSDEQPKQENEENVQLIWPFKRRKINTVDNDLLTQKLCNIIHHNRRNSVSALYNEDSVSFCILIDNTCIITEEENEEPEKVCYTELSDECLAEIQSNCTKHDENLETAAQSPQQENACEYSDSFVLDCEEDKTLEESWDEEVGCVETVISDDIAEDIEICGPSSPKVDALSDNDESGVFSSSEHTDKVKFIYGDNMCTDDARFVETLYKTPQMDVNKTLYNRETRVSEKYDRYYDNDSLEKMLSESNERPVSPYVPQYMETMFPFGKGNSKETPENKENMDIESLSPFQSKENASDIVVDTNVDKMERENMHSIDVSKTRDETVHSCESSVDNVFTYNQKDEDAIYTSSSPEVSSTTSEEKNSGILLKITNFKGSRISRINDISRVNKSSCCKFTEEKEYLHTSANYSSNRPLLTKAAQKYIPPLKESIRDLKVQLSLPQHSLMKLKQLKLSKDEPKVNKQNANIPRIAKKPKPKFEDVLKSIDEIQFKKHKENTKKTKKAIPKVVIKKNVNGSHYASTSNKDDFNPDMTGRKWQPWVFIEKNHFIDKMATRKKTKAIYSHRKRTYVLAEKFQKYKSANSNSTKFVITPPISDNHSSGLKYTIRLKHNY